jgi:adenylate cyclase class IV
VQQVKIRIHQPWVVQNRLKLMGAAYLGSWSEKDTYFLQPAGCFLKIKRMKGSAFLVRLRKSGGGFTKESEFLKSPEKKENELSHIYGISKIVEKRVRAYSSGGFLMRIHSIEGLGDFLLIENETGPIKPLLRRLGIEKPEFVSLAFSEML